MRIVLFANTDWFLYNFKLSLAQTLKRAGHEVVLLSPPGEFGPRLRERGFEWIPFALSRSGINPLAELLAVRRLQALYRALQPDLVHHFTIKCVIYGSMAARGSKVRKIVNSITGLGFALLATSFKASLIRPVVVHLYRASLRGTSVIFQNADNRDTLQTLHALQQCEVFVISGDGVDTDFFRPPQVEPAAPVVLMMGRLLWSKGVGDFVQAAALVRGQRAEVQFLLAGEQDAGNPENIDDATLKQWKAQGDVQFLGQRSDVLALQQSCSVAVLASTQGEGMPRALLEAAACARPLVATDVPGSRELVRDGHNGFLVPPSHAEALAQAILKVLDDPLHAVRMGQCARQCVLDEFSDERITKRTLQVYGMTGC